MTVKLQYNLKFLDEIDSSKLIEFYIKYGTLKQSSIGNKILNSDGSFKVFGTVAEVKETGEIVAAYLAKPQKLLCKPKIKAVQSMDTLVAEHVRGQSLTEILAKMLYNKLSEKNIDVVVGIPNLEIEYLRTKKLFWKTISRVYRITLFYPKIIRKLCTLFMKAQEIKYRAAVNKNILNFDLVELLEGVKNSEIVKLLQVNESFFVCYSIDERIHIGIIRSPLRKNILKKFLELGAVANYFDNSLMLSYCTLNTPSSDYLRFLPVLRTKSLNFAGRNIGKQGDVLQHNLCIEYLEFDTYAVGF